MRSEESAETDFSAEILNAALEMSLEWGENWLKDITERISNAYPKLTTEDAEKLNRRCRKIMNLAFKLIAADYGKQLDKPDASVLKPLLEKYPQINEKNLSRLYSQGMYYALK